ncbi:hypothetical protein KBI23_23595 [bacterium]|nr:hypothetical protein [bacterium]MBP9810214.1 hypothetical protein [bacterium]
MQATAGFFVIDFILRPFLKIYQKMPLMIFLILLVVYGLIAYLVWKSAFKAEQQY